MRYLNDFKALLFDIDGTLIPKDLILPSETEAALKALRQDFVTGVCTGRSFVAAKAGIMHHFPDSAIHIVSGGAQVVTNNGEIIWQITMEHSLVANLVHKLLTHSAEVIVTKNTALYVTPKVFTESRSHPWHIPAQPLEELQDHETTEIVVYNLNDQIKTLLQTNSAITAKLLLDRHGREYFDVTARGITKRQGLDQWAKYTHIALDDIVGFGDGDNDLEFLNAVGFSVAMPHAPETVKQIASKTLSPQHTNLGVYLHELLEAKPL